MHFFSYTGIDIVSLRWSLLRIESNDNRQRRLPMLALRCRTIKDTGGSHERRSHTSKMLIQYDPSVSAIFVTPARWIPSGGHSGVPS